MAYLYIQNTGQLFHGPALLGTGYAGREEGYNNPEMQRVKGIGPLPCGWYTIQPPHDNPNVGKFALRLIPDAANEMFGRDSFYMHGDSSEHPGLASHGCIVQRRDVRGRVAAGLAHDNRLQVVAVFPRPDTDSEIGV